VLTSIRLLRQAANWGVPAGRQGDPLGYAGDVRAGVAQARRIEAGVVHVNDQTIADEPQLPLGGVKDSGWGRSGPESMADFTETQWITTRDGTGHYPI
jgi:hypothetical protein